jgi:hypothetical protein
MQAIGDVTLRESSLDERLNLLERNIGVDDCSPGQSVLWLDRENSLLCRTKNPFRLAGTDIPDEPLPNTTGFVDRVSPNAQLGKIFEKLACESGVNKFLSLFEKRTASSAQLAVVGICCPTLVAPATFDVA